MIPSQKPLSAAPAQHPSVRRRGFLTLMLALHTCGLAFALNSPVRAADFEGFTEPFRDIDVAASESGVLESVDVVEGDIVTRGQMLGSLSTDVLKASLAIAEVSRDAQGHLKSAIAELQLRTESHRKLSLLRQTNHATQDEVDRAALELENAAARLLSVQEELKIRKFEFDRIQLQIDRRAIRSPIDGVVTRVHHQAGEFVPLHLPVAVTVVQLDPLLASFSVPSVVGKPLQRGRTVHVRIASADQPGIPGEIDSISPVIDPQSNTIQIKIRIPNPDYLHKSGERCFLTLPNPTPKNPVPKNPPK